MKPIDRIKLSYTMTSLVSNKQVSLKDELVYRNERLCNIGAFIIALTI